MGVSGLRRWLDYQNCTFNVTQPMPHRLARPEERQNQRDEQQTKQQQQLSNRSKKRKALKQAAEHGDAETAQQQTAPAATDEEKEEEPKYDWGDGVDHLFLDMNSFVHLSYSITKPYVSAVVQKVTKMIEKSLHYFRPQRTLSLCFDGPAPISKLNTQRARRQGSADICTSMRDNTQERGFSPAELCTGSIFLYKIERAVREFVLGESIKRQFPHLKIFFSGTREAGEGEVKIVHRLIQLTPAITPSFDNEANHPYDDTKKTHQPAARGGGGGFFQSVKNAVQHFVGRPSSAPTHSTSADSTPATTFLLPVVDDTVVIMGNDTDLVLNCIACLPYHNMYVCHPDSYLLTSIADLLYAWVRPGSPKQLSLGILPSVRLDFYFIMALAGGDHYPGIDESEAQRIWHHYHTLRSSSSSMPQRRHDSLVVLSPTGPRTARPITKALDTHTSASNDSGGDPLSDQHIGSSQRRYIINASFLRQLVSAKFHENYHEQHQRSRAHGQHRHHAHHGASSSSHKKGKGKKGNTNSKIDPRPGFALLAGALWSLTASTTGLCPNYAFLYRHVAPPSLKSLRAAADHSLLHVHHTGVYGTNDQVQPQVSTNCNTQTLRHDATSSNESVVVAAETALPAGSASEMHQESVKHHHTTPQQPEEEREFPMLSPTPLLSPLQVYTAVMPKIALLPHAVQRSLKHLAAIQADGGEGSSSNNNNNNNNNNNTKKNRVIVNAHNKGASASPNMFEQKLVSMASTPSIVQLVRRIFHSVDPAYLTAEERELNSLHVVGDEDRRWGVGDATTTTTTTATASARCPSSLVGAHTLDCTASPVITFQDAESVRYNEAPGYKGGVVFAAKGMLLSRHVQFHRPPRKDISLRVGPSRDANVEERYEDENNVVDDDDDDDGSED